MFELPVISKKGKHFSINLLVRGYELTNLKEECGDSKKGYLEIVIGRTENEMVKKKRTKNNSQFYGLHRESVDDFCTPAACQYIFLM